MLKSIIITFCSIIPLVGVAQSLSRQGLNKLDPRFHAVVADQMPMLRKVTMPPSTKPVATAEDGSPLYGAIIYTTNPSGLLDDGIPLNSICSSFATARLTPAELARLIEYDDVTYVDAGRPYRLMNDVTVGLTGADLLHIGYIDNTPYTGTGAIVCFIDTGIDWEHLDFRDPNNPSQSRILYIWDQLLNPTGGENSPAETGCNYGVEYTKAQIEDEIDGSPTNFVRSFDNHGHGTHVAGIAAGNGAAYGNGKYAGMAPNADILIVKAGEKSFNSTDLVNALSYARQKAQALGKPIVVNMSIGTYGGPHDGTMPKEVAADEFINSGPGRAVVLSAGNAGADNSHLQGTIPAGSTRQIVCTVPEYVPQAESDDDDFGFEFWFDEPGVLTTRLTSPNGESVTQVTVGTKTSHTNDGSIFISNGPSYTGNGDLVIEGWMYDNDEAKPPAQGDWIVSITNNSDRSMSYHCWLYDREIGEEDTVAVLLENGDSHYTLSNTAADAIIVGSYAHRWRWHAINDTSYYGGATDHSDGISPYSSIGPTRSGVQKPDITTPGQFTASSMTQHANTHASWKIQGEKHRIMAGTSMSTPVVTGAVALLFQQNPDYTANAVTNLLTSSADQDEYTGAVWNATWGYGRLNIFKAMANAIHPDASAAQEIAVYDDWGGDIQYYFVGNDYPLAVRFTPEISGEITGFFFHPYNNSQLTGPLHIEIWTDRLGNPDTKLGNTILYEHNKVLPFSWNFVNLNGINVNVTSNIDYHVVLRPSSGDVLNVLIDAASVDNRTSYNADGISWTSDPRFDLRFRPVISTDRGDLTGVQAAGDAHTPKKFDLSQNYPNPFNPVTTFMYQLPKEADVSIRIFNLLGKEVKNLVDTRQSVGKYHVTWDGRDENDIPVSSGVYFIRMNAGEFSKVRKIMLVK